MAPYCTAAPYCYCDVIIGVAITDDPKRSQFLELDPHIWDAAAQSGSASSSETTTALKELIQQGFIGWSVKKLCGTAHRHDCMTVLARRGWGWGALVGCLGHLSPNDQ